MRGDQESPSALSRPFSKKTVRQALDESMVLIKSGGAEAPPSEDVRSPETYVGYARAENLGSPEGMARDSRKTYSLPEMPALNQWGFGGSWNVHSESSKLESAPGKIVFGSTAATSIWFWARRITGRPFASGSS